jgi:hypothetical protein
MTDRRIWLAVVVAALGYFVDAIGLACTLALRETFNRDLDYQER